MKCVSFEIGEELASLIACLGFYVLVIAIVVALVCGAGCAQRVIPTSAPSRVFHPEIATPDGLPNHAWTAELRDRMRRENRSPLMTALDWEDDLERHPFVAKWHRVEGVAK